MRRMGSPIADHRSSSTAVLMRVGHQPRDVRAQRGDVAVPPARVLAVLLLEVGDLPAHLAEPGLGHPDPGAPAGRDQVEGDEQRVPAAGRAPRSTTGRRIATAGRPRRRRARRSSSRRSPRRARTSSPGAPATGSNRASSGHHSRMCSGRLIDLEDHLGGRVDLDVALDGSVLHSAPAFRNLWLHVSVRTESRPCATLGCGSGAPPHGNWLCSSAGADQRSESVSGATGRVDLDDDGLVAIRDRPTH